MRVGLWITFQLELSNINENYIIELEEKLKNKIGRKVVFFMDSEDDGIVLYDKEIMYYEN